MKAMKRVMASAMALAMAASIGASAFADDVFTMNGEGSSTKADLNVTAAATTFSVTVPAVLPLHFSGDSKAVAADDYKIINNSTGPIKVTGVQVTDGSWTVKSYSHTFTEDPVDSHTLGLEFSVDGSDEKAATDGDTNKTELPTGWIINGVDSEGYGTEQQIKVDARASAISGELPLMEGAAGIIFTVGWHTAS